MASTPEFNGEQLAAVRVARWHQNGDALLTLDAAQEWIGELGLVLFAPRPQQLAAPAPSLVEATLGRAAEAPTAAETATARGLVARMVSDGSALPLNLLGGPGDVPDFVVSAQVFSYIFTLRGEKAWKQPPGTSGAANVSPLAAKVYDVLAERGSLTAGELVSELGRELTENAVLRALSELWTQLRALPLLQQDGSATLWELTSRRFTKAIKAGANAGQPTALSALVSLYLAQTYAASGEEVETFLSPLAARSRVREVLHGLTAGRQLEPVVLEGKTLLYMPGSLPEFPAAVAEPSAVDSEAAPAEAPKKVGTGRIRSFAGERKGAGESRGKPARSFGERSREGGTRPTRRFGARAEGASERERRPFRREGGAGGERPSFTRPWDEQRKPRREGSAASGRADSFSKFRKGPAQDRRPLGDREQAGLPPEGRVFSKPKFEREAKARDEAKRQYKPREGAVERGGFKPRSFERRGPERGAQDRGGKPGGFGGKRPYKPREAEGGERSFTKRPYTPRTSEGGERGGARPRFDRGAKPGGFGAKRPYKPRETEGGERPFAKRPYAPRMGEGGERGSSNPRFDRGEKPGGFRAKRPYKPRGAEGEERTFPKRPYSPRGEQAGEPPAAKRPYTPRGEGGFERGAAPARKGFGANKFAGKPGGRPAAKFGGGPGAKSGGRPGAKFGGKPAGKFGPKKFGSKPGGFGGKRGGAAGGARPTPRGPKAEE